MAVVRTGDEAPVAPDGGRVSWSQRLSAGETTAWITRANYEGPPIRKGDKLRRIDRRGDWYEIASVNDRHPSDYVLTLSEA